MPSKNPATYDCAWQERSGGSHEHGRTLGLSLLGNRQPGGRTIPSAARGVPRNIHLALQLIQTLSAQHGGAACSTQYNEYCLDGVHALKSGPLPVWRSNSQPRLLATSTFSSALRLTRVISSCKSGRFPQSTARLRQVVRGRTKKSDKISLQLPVTLANISGS